MPGRKASFGELEQSEKLMRVLQAHIDKILDKAAEYLENGYLSFSEPMEACIFAGEGVKVVANSNGSYGYLYMCAFFDDCGD